MSKRKRKEQKGLPQFVVVFRNVNADDLIDVVQDGTDPLDVEGAIAAVYERVGSSEIITKPKTTVTVGGRNFEIGS